MKYLVGTIVAVVLAAASANAQEDETQDFVQEATVSNDFEIASSRLALERTQSAAVRQFAEHMIEDHGKAAEQLKAAVDKTELGVGMPDTLDDKHAEMMQELGKAQGTEFDRKYVGMQVAAHQNAVELFEDYIDADDASAPVQQFAKQTLPVLKEHDRQIEALSQRMAGL